jgi:lipid II:glycine glycyltransferase (peptidoglycan interpeptide bridge formation enzyme)
MTRERTTFEMLQLNELDNQIIDQLNSVLDLTQNSTPFHDLQLNKFVSNHFSLESFVLIALVRDEIKGFIICHKKRNDTLITSPFQLSLLTYGGPVCLPGNDSIITDLLKHLKRHSVNGSIYIKSGYKLSPDLYKRSGYRVKTIPTLLIDTDRNEQLIWDSFDNRIRRNIKKALKHNIEITVGNDKYFDDFADIYRDLCERKGLCFHGNDYYKKLYYILQKNVKMSIFYAKYNGTIISAMSALEYKGDINPWFGGTKVEHTNTGAGSLVYWEILKHASSGGFKTFDFLGLDIGPIAFYKKGFGGNEANVCHSTYSPLYSRIRNRIKKTIK